MIVMGVDPGTITTGYGVLEQGAGRIKVLEYGIIQCDPKVELPIRLGKIFRETRRILDLYRPASLALENIFFAKFPRAAMALGHARGAIMVAAGSLEIPIHEYAPRLVKQAAVGKGSASKEQVALMMRSHLCLLELPQPEDASDALAVAFCHLIQMAPGLSPAA